MDLSTISKKNSEETSTMHRLEIIQHVSSSLTSVTSLIAFILLIVTLVRYIQKSAKSSQGLDPLFALLFAVTLFTSSLLMSISSGVFSARIIWDNVIWRSKLVNKLLLTAQEITRVASVEHLFIYPFLIFYFSARNAQRMDLNVLPGTRLSEEKIKSWTGFKGLVVLCAVLFMVAVSILPIVQIILSMVSAKVSGSVLMMLRVAAVLRWYGLIQVVLITLFISTLVLTIRTIVVTKPGSYGNTVVYSDMQRGETGNHVKRNAYLNAVVYLVLTCVFILELMRQWIQSFVIVLVHSKLESNEYLVFAWIDTAVMITLTVVFLICYALSYSNSTGNEVTLSGDYESTTLLSDPYHQSLMTPSAPTHHMAPFHPQQ